MTKSLVADILKASREDSQSTTATNRKKAQTPAVMEPAIALEGMLVPLLPGSVWPVVPEVWAEVLREAPGEAVTLELGTGLLCEFREDEMSAELMVIVG